MPSTGRGGGSCRLRRPRVLLPAPSRPPPPVPLTWARPRHHPILGEMQEKGSIPPAPALLSCPLRPAGRGPRAGINRSKKRRRKADRRPRGGGRAALHPPRCPVLSGSVRRGILSPALGSARPHARPAWARARRSSTARGQGHGHGPVPARPCPPAGGKESPGTAGF